MVGHAQNVSLGGPGRDVGPLHGQRDAVGGDECEDDEVEPSTRDELRAKHSDKYFKFYFLSFNIPYSHLNPESGGQI